MLGSKHIKRFYLQEFNEYIKYGKNLAAPRNFEIFQGERILINRILSKDKIDGVYLVEPFVNNTDVFNLIPNPLNTISIKALYAIILSKLCATYFKRSNINLNREAFPKINVNTLETFPIPEFELLASQVVFAEKADRMLSLNKGLHEVSQKFQRSIQRKFTIEVLPNKLQDWYLLTYAQFISELGKKKVRLSLSEEAEWEGYFLQESNKALELKSKIETTDQEIDRMVYELYELTEEEIRIVEGQ